MRIMVFISFFLASFFSCTDVFFDEYENTPENNFEIFWQDYDRFYSFHLLKGLNWDSVYLVNRPLVNDNTSPKELFDILSSMVVYLHDGHADIYSSNFGRVHYDFAKGKPINKLMRINHYVSLTRLNPAIEYGIIQSKFGYIYISNFGTETKNYEDIDKIIKIFVDKEIKGLIIDIRSNGGGNSINANTIASRFYDKERIYSFVRFKNGTGHNDFGPWLSSINRPIDIPFLKPVIVLTNREVFSSAESFVLEMKVLPHVKIVGDTTGGGSGNPIMRYLPNGISYRVPRWQQVDTNMNHFEEIGIFPDIPVWISDDDMLKNRDAILDRALDELDK